MLLVHFCDTLGDTISLEKEDSENLLSTIGSFVQILTKRGFGEGAIKAFIKL